MFDNLDPMMRLFAYLVIAAIGWAAFYYTVKAAVKWGHIEAEADKIKADAKL